METFKIENIEIPPIRVSPDLQDDGTLLLHTYIMDTITEKRIELESQAIREALVAMGWTLPESGKKLAPVLDGVRRVVNEIWGNDNHSWNDLKEAVSELASALEEFEKTDPKENDNG